MTSRVKTATALSWKIVRTWVDLLAIASPPRDDDGSEASDTYNTSCHDEDGNGLWRRWKDEDLCLL